MSVQENNFTEIANAIRAKKGTTAPIVANNFASEILSIPTGGVIPVRKVVNFLDYDGTLIAGWTIAEAQVATALPTPPAHDRLVFQGWNFTLAQINALTMPMNIGAVYTTASGASEFDVTLTTVTTTAVTVRIQNVSGNLTINWGDGTEGYISSGAGLKTASHTYAANGNYTISVDSTGTYYPYGTEQLSYNMFNVATSHICTAVRLGARCTKIGAYSFYRCYSLTYISIPQSVTSIGAYSFFQGYSLTYISIPQSVTNIEQNAFNSCYSLTYISIPQSVTNIEQNAFIHCYGLNSVIIPQSVTNIDGVAFYNCHTVKSYHLLRTIPPTLSNVNAFTGINDICIMYVPPGSAAAYKAATNWATYADRIYEFAPEQYAQLTGGAG